MGDVKENERKGERKRENGGDYQKYMKSTQTRELRKELKETEKERERKLMTQPQLYEEETDKQAAKEMDDREAIKGKTRKVWEHETQRKMKLRKEEGENRGGNHN